MDHVPIIAIRRSFLKFGVNNAVIFY